ncbi:metallophosphoesterase [Propionivibrio sp.]|uniref:metallophosphoesterase n=1 Tax=Propionivibrio sp. TaxID=2212460 RepID=UPI003BF0CEE5
MRIALYSDLHRESSPWEPPELDVDVVILAGDIGSHTRGLAWAAGAFRRSPVSPTVLYVAGNHEYYDSHLGLLDEMQKPVWEQAGVFFLERRSLELGGVHFLGCTLWSGFDLHGADKAYAHMAVARSSINDYWMIQAHGGMRLAPRDTRKLHRTAVRWLNDELAKPFDGKTVLITHFAPHRGCVASQHQGSDVSPYFVTDLSRLMEKHKIDLWCHGHTHTNTDFVAENGCHVISNQLGYKSERTSGDTGFRHDLVIEI